MMRKTALLLLSLCFLASTLWAQSRVITGKVTDQQGNPIQNASVLVKGTSIGTTTGADGSYRLEVPASARVLEFSSIGMGLVERTIGNLTSFNINLVSEASELSEVVVQVPYGIIKKTAFTGSEATVTAKSISRQQVTNVTKAIEGLVAGVQMTNGGGAPGSGAAIRIRGIGSINAATGPLYILNGVPYDGSISSLNTDDIENVTVLKDAAAAALYGSRAANGVIMITTKKGRRGKSNVTASLRQGYMSRGIPEYDRVNSQQYYELMWEASRNKFISQGQSTSAAAASASNELTGPNGLIYNAYNVAGNQLIDPTTGKMVPNARLLWEDSWEKALFQTAARTNATVSVSGGGDKSDYLLSMGYLNEEGTMKFTGYKRYNLRLNVNAAPTSWLNTGVNIDGAFSDDQTVINGGTATSNPFYFTRQMGPIYPVYERNKTTGEYVLDPMTGERKLDWGTPAQMGTRPYAGNSNLLGSLELDDRLRYRLNANANTFMEVKFLKDFSFKTTLGFTIVDDNATTFQNSEFGDAANVKGRSTKTTGRTLSTTLNEVLSWNKEFGRHNVRALVGHEAYKYQYSELTLTRTGFQFPGFNELDNAAVTESIGGSFIDRLNLESYFGGINYSFDDKYLLSGSIRRDGSSRFHPDNRWGTFYAAGLGWRISQEEFLKNVSWLSELKLKASYGEQGNDNIGLYYQYEDYYYADGVGNYNGSTRTANPELKWEGNKTLNIGADFGFFKNKIQGSFEWYSRRSNNLLFDVPQPPSPGFPAAALYQNFGEMKNVGVDVQLGFNAITKKNFDWRIDLNVGHFKNTVVTIPPTQKNSGGIVRGSQKIQEGRSIYDWFIREYAGVDAATGDALYYQDILGTDGKPTGERKLTNNITNGSFYYHGTAIPKFTGGLNNSFRYKGFDLSVLLTFSYGGLTYDGNYGSIMHPGSYGTHWHTDILDRWQKPGDQTNVPRIQNALATQAGISTRYLFDASFMNVKNITLSYTFPARLANRLKVGGIQIFGNVDNAVLLSARKGLNPQRSFDGTSDATYPPFRTITAGLTVNL